MRLSPILSAYIARQFAVAFGTVLLVILGIILLFDLIELIRRSAGRPEIGMGLVLVMAFLKLPQMLHTVLPFAVMIGAMICFWRLTRTHELVVARSAGISAWQFIAPLLGVAAAFGTLEITAFNPMAAAMYGRYERLQDELINARTTAFDLSEVGLWLREPHDDGEMVVHSQDVRQDGLQLFLKDPQIFIYDKPDHFYRRISAESSTLIEGVFEVKRAWIMEGGKPSTFVENIRIPTQLTLERIHDNFASPETLSFWQLPGFIRFFERAGFTANKHRLYLQSLLASPVLYCGMVLLAALFSLKPNNRSGGLTSRVAAGVATGFTVYFFSKVVYAFGLSSTLPQALAAWTPAVFAGLVGLGGLFHLEDG
ncbi:LPS export ABC transporter permease LptG [Paramagnetospirillum kuznetsovii]|uniref:LPS export ABC transporter permease LptG n=1 Tax=Paramagnetospirillum kuznetsovii TaxID=2053833 RepID=A0A364P275_9PROT|nr:LPS export ABC transporter permease LptG [Paramagnetospirillum kuznetsovii]RAU23267.1 LPS export ABC transporter permease LptG [Paramagnetospirillum kuznetsovii]